jgi:hypothetical protein
MMSDAVHTAKGHVHVIQFNIKFSIKRKQIARRNVGNSTSKLPEARE